MCAFFKYIHKIFPFQRAGKRAKFSVSRWRQPFLPSLTGASSSPPSGAALPASHAHTCSGPGRPSLRRRSRPVKTLRVVRRSACASAFLTTPLCSLLQVWESVSRSGVSHCLQLPDGSPPGSSVHGLLQARILEWVASSSSRESSRPRDQALYSLCHGLEHAPGSYNAGLSHSSVVSQGALRAIWVLGVHGSVQSLSRVRLFATP